MTLNVFIMNYFHEVDTYDSKHILTLKQTFDVFGGFFLGGGTDLSLSPRGDRFDMEPARERKEPSLSRFPLPICTNQIWKTIFFKHTHYLKTFSVIEIRKYEMSG